MKYAALFLFITCGLISSAQYYDAPTSVDEHYVIGDGGAEPLACLLYTSDAADERSSVNLGGRRIIKKKITKK